MTIAPTQDLCDKIIPISVNIEGNQKTTNPRKNLPQLQTISKAGKRRVTLIKTTSAIYFTHNKIECNATSEYTGGVIWSTDARNLLRAKLGTVLKLNQVASKSWADQILTMRPDRSAQTKRNSLRDSYFCRWRNLGLRGC